MIIDHIGIVVKSITKSFVFAKQGLNIELIDTNLRALILRDEVAE